MNLHTKISRRSVLKSGTATLASVALVSCGTNSVSFHSSTHTLQLWTWSGASILQSAFNAVASTYPAEFKNVRCNITTVPTGDTGESLSLALASNNVPDIVQLNYNQVPQFAEAGMLEEINDLITPVKDDLYAGAQKISAYNGVNIAFPWQLKSKLFYYRADLFNQAGIDPATIHTSDDFITAGQQFHEKFPQHYILNLGSKTATNAGYWLSELFSSFPGARFADRTGNYYLNTNPAFSESLTFLKRIRDAKIAYPVDDFSADWPQAIQNEKICALLAPTWMEDFLPGYATAAQAGKWEVKYWPRLFTQADARYGSDSGGTVFVIPKGAPNKTLAREFLTKMRLDRQGAVAAFTATGTPSVLKSTQTTMLDSLNNSKKPSTISDDQWFTMPQNFFGKNYYPTEFASYDFLTIFEYDPAATKELTILGPWVDEALQGQTSIEDALAGAQHDMATLYGNPYQQ